MADDLEDDDPLEGTEGSGLSRIARPPVPSAIPPLTLRGLGTAASSASPSSVPAELGSTEDLENRGIASATTPRSIAKPSPLESRTTGDENELSRLQTSGSGISQIARAHPVAGGILRGLNTVGEIASAFSPQVKPLLRAIPGTEEHHEQLIGKASGRIGEDLGEAKEQGAIGETQARTEQAESEADKNRAATAAAGQPKAKEEKWDGFAGFTDTDGTPLIREENSGQVVRANDKKPPSGFQPTKPAAQQKPDTPEQQFIDEFQRTNPQGTIAQAITAYSNATQKPERPEKPQRQLAVINGKVVELVPGMDATGAQSIGGSEKAGVAGQSAQDALAYATDYMAGKKFTGPGDEALMEKYFELAKPSSGFRMTQAQIEMLQHARDLMGGIEAKAKHLFTPEAPYFSDTQRQQIVDTMSQIENSKGGHGGGAAHGGGKDLGSAPEGKAEGATGTMPDGTKVVIKGGRLVSQ